MTTTESRNGILALMVALAAFELVLFNVTRIQVARRQAAVAR
jgi:hypothetical protein